MNSRAVALLTAILLLTTSRIAVGQATMTVSNGSVGPMTITTAVAGSEPTAVVSNNTTYHVINPAANGLVLITARLDTPMPPGTTLFITLAAPPGATSLGPIALTDVSQNVVIDIPDNLDVAGLTITYTFVATAAAGVVPSQSRTVTLDVL